MHVFQYSLYLYFNFSPALLALDNLKNEYQTELLKKTKSSETTSFLQIIFQPRISPAREPELTDEPKP